MRSFTEQEIQSIADHPLGDTLDSFRPKLHELNESNEEWQKEMGSLVLALVGHEAAYRLPSPDESQKNLANALFSIFSYLRGNRSRIEYFQPLIKQIIHNTTDLDIWITVHSLVKTFHELTPPSGTITTNVPGTPVKTTSSWLTDDVAVETLEKELYSEIQDCIHRSVGGFFEKFFSLSDDKEKQILKEIMLRHNGEKWQGFPPDPWEREVWEWLRSLENDFLADAPNMLLTTMTTKTANQFKERKGQMEKFFQKRTRKKNSTFTYKDVFITGKYKRSEGTFMGPLLQITRHVRSVFADQPLRRFVHAFLLCGTKMELWIFDRSGLYSSGKFDIHKEPDKFARALVRYASMNSEELGLDTVIQGKAGQKYAVFGKCPNNTETSIELKRLLIYQRAIVCRGTTCYEAQRNEVVKFSWVSDKRTAEVDHLKLAAKREVKGLAKVTGYHRITTVKEMRAGLEFSKRYQIMSAKSNEVSSSSSKAPQLTTGNSSGLPSSSGDSVSLRKRKSGLNQELEQQQQSGDEVKPTSYPPDSDEPYENRIYSCLVISPAGRIISKFTSIIELLQSLRDAIRAHQSLYTIGNILHRDISCNNIIITDPKVADGFHGMLIDLDLAVVEDSGRSRPRYPTGTVQFMAIEVLLNIDHTYRHDLESFFYVLIWMCTQYSWDNGFGSEGGSRSNSDFLQRWERGSFRDIANAKRGDMTVDGLEELMEEFPAEFEVIKPLCVKVRDILFGKLRRMIYGTPPGHADQLYDPIIAAYDETITQLKE